MQIVELRPIQVKRKLELKDIEQNLYLTTALLGLIHKPTCP
ncbi:MAG: hypothetical protein WAT53_04810 [Nitrosomonas sp.]